MSSVVVGCAGARVRLVAPTRVLDRFVERTARFAPVVTDGPADASLRARCVEPGTWELFGRRRTPLATMRARPPAVADALVDHLHLRLARHARDALFVHAGVFELDGRVVMVPGRSMTGKSTLVAEALRRGATYFSDEFAVLDPTGHVQPYLRPVHLRQPDGTRRLVDPLELGGRVARDARPVDVVLVTRFEQDQVWRPEPDTGAQAALPIIDNTVRARLDPAATGRIAALLARSTTVLRGPRGDAATTLDLLSAHFQRSDGAEPVRTHTGTPTPEPRVVTHRG